MSVFDAVTASRFAAASPFGPLVCFAVKEPVVKTVVVKEVRADDVAPPCGTESLVRRLCRACLGKRVTVVVEANGKTACLRAVLSDVGRDFIQLTLLEDHEDTPILIPLRNVAAIQCDTTSGTICDFFDDHRHDDSP